ncbi:MAG: S66 peptidase family protein [Bacillota bacterium]|jgi:muramoyltetrapeptide carboxypeptidase
MTKKAPAIVQGDAVAIVAPSGAVHKEALDRGIAIIEELGYEVKLGKSVLNRFGYLAGEDVDRAADFTWAWTDPEIKAVIAARGGYGATRMLPYLDFSVLKEHKKIFVGYSDITALHLAFWKEMRLVTFHGPMVESGEESGLSEPYNLEGLRRALDGTSVVGEMPLPPGTELFALGAGTAEGQLVGGNLSLVAATVGTRWELDTRGKILFLEEVGERPYRVDRMLCQLESTGKLADAAGILLGDFTDCDAAGSSPSFTTCEILRQYFGRTGKPCLMRFPAGHGTYKATLPLGAKVLLDADRGVVRLLERPTA